MAGRLALPLHTSIYRLIQRHLSTFELCDTVLNISTPRKWSNYSNWPVMTSKDAPRRADAVLSRRYVEGLVSEGRSVVIFNQAVLKVDPWLRYHPGGDKAIMHMVGRDATDEINA